MTMQQWKIIPFTLAAGALAAMACAQGVRFRVAAPPTQSFRGQAGFPRAESRLPSLGLASQPLSAPSPRHPTPLPQPGMASPTNGFNPSSILQPQPPTRFHFINPFNAFYPYSAYGSFYPWSYSAPGYLPYTNPYAYPYGNVPYGYESYPGYGNPYESPYSMQAPPQQPQLFRAGVPPRPGREERSNHSTKPARSGKNEVMAMPEASVLLDGKAEPESSMTHPLTVGSGLHTLVIRPRIAPGRK